MVLQVESEEEKRRVAREVLADLPEWFGIPESTEEYIDESAKMPFWASYSNNEAAGFISLKQTSPYTAELYVTGVKKRFHRQGIGRELFSAFYEFAKQSGYEFLQVKTVDEGRYEEYDQTRLFYESLGFRKLEVFPTLWDEWNPCLIMVMAVK
ncbi:MAG: GNAT family N-acetyltransferase [Clostridiaceae bacterium]